MFVLYHREDAHTPKEFQVQMPCNEEVLPLALSREAIASYADVKDLYRNVL